MKTITLERSELVWETRKNTWSEQDWKQFQKQVDAAAKDEKIYNHIWAAAINEMVQKYDWNFIVKLFKGDIDENESPFVDFYPNPTHDPEWHYKETLYDIIVETMREDNYNCDIDDVSYADDYTEDFYVEDENEDK